MLFKACLCWAPGLFAPTLGLRSGIPVRAKSHHHRFRLLPARHLTDCAHRRRKRLGEAFGKTVRGGKSRRRPAATHGPHRIGARASPERNIRWVSAPAGAPWSSNPHVPEQGVNFKTSARADADRKKLIDIPLVLVAHPESGFRTLAEMIAQSKTTIGRHRLSDRPGPTRAQTICRSSCLKKGHWRQSHACALSWHSAPVMTDLLGGQIIQLASVDLTAAAPHIPGGPR